MPMRLVLLALWGALLLMPAGASYAHGVSVEHTLETVIALAATYDSGEPMAGAQVTVYAPNDPTTAWHTGTCDEMGRYRFAPDPALPGTWTIQVRQAGHGKTIYVEVGSSTTPATSAALVQVGSAAPYTLLQLIVMGGTVVWGCIGTALFFARRSG
ncbi:MAG: carboxypeptidase regulatory-like domain-containing protein, partial [Chloroflexaceae bacterium]|nr:carboxypeptidase regulatory-like domain-containing protein [Chloroflexaceae bacterium]NJL34533.1 carboxypeptidase regulatory-like domain-containing protein [Chloroflexaceae bacterium]